MAESNEQVETLERGNLFFLYRPDVETEEVSGMDDVQRFYMVMAPHGEDRFRLAVIGQKKLPDIENGGDKYWGFIETSSNSPDRISKGLRAEEYETETRGERHQGAARPVGEGVYRIVRHEDHTHLVYALELPSSPGEAQRAFNIEREGSFVLQVKNPEKGSPNVPHLDEGDQADLPQDLQDEFEGNDFVDADPVRFLDKEGLEFLLIGAKEDVSKELGIELDPQDETVDRAEVFRVLKLRKSDHPTDPLTEGSWA